MAALDERGALQGWLPLRTWLVVAALAALALAALTFGLLQLVSQSARETALVRAEADAALLASKLDSLPRDLRPEERAAEVETLVRIRALEGSDGGLCDSGERQRAVALLRRPGGDTIGTDGVDWPRGLSNRIALAKEVACQADGGEAMVVTRELDDGTQLLLGRTVSRDPKLVRSAYLLAAGIALAFLLLSIGLASYLARSWRRRLDIFNALLDRADANRFSERADEDDPRPEFRLLAHHLNALLGRSADMIAGLGRLHRHVAHDLRGPVMVARKHLEAIDGDEAQEERLAAADARLALVDKRCRTLLGIIDAEVSPRAQSIVRVDERLRTLVDDMFTYLADEKELTFECDLSPAQTRAVGDLLDRMLENVLSNAIKFAEPGSTVRCSVAEAVGEVRIAVENDGPRVPEDTIRRIFEPGFSDALGQASGHGLGLALVKTVALRAGGDVRATNLAAGFRLDIILPAVAGSDSLPSTGRSH
ncbi:hypothetical protein GCM10010923_07760 [Blastomonas marina]|uniref:histidine kinase n=1 Tax=Blastomonas marina TaxID=1867408 RepID=A0ABQ1F6W4_9SPHN|nr:sensor histidine kinase [Blastomonas marina]GGA01441.1 hypothetical protein GCM10010923_07760 [Blastomonas marina]